MKVETFTCCHCGQEHPIENRVMVGDDALCEQCANEETVICSRCGERVYRDECSCTVRKQATENKR